MRIHSHLHFFSISLSLSFSLSLSLFWFSCVSFFVWLNVAMKHGVWLVCDEQHGTYVLSATNSHTPCTIIYLVAFITAYFVLFNFRAVFLLLFHNLLLSMVWYDDDGSSLILFFFTFSTTLLWNPFIWQRINHFESNICSLPFLLSFCYLNYFVL